MLIYKDLISNDELLTDTFKLEECHGGAIYKVKGKMMKEDFGIDESAIGGNASAEGGGDEGADPSSVSGIDVVLLNRLQPCLGLNKIAFKTYIKDYMKAIKTHLDENKPDEVKVFQKGCQEFVKEILSGFKDFEFFQGESMNPEGMVVCLRWETPEGTEDESPFLYFFKHGIEEEKA